MPPRLLRPKDESTATESSESPSEVKTGKRKAISSACLPCRKRKSKCDGSLPACSTCVAVYRTECMYDTDSDHRRKGALKRDIQSLQQRNDALDVIVASLQALPEQDAISLLQTLRTDTNPDAIATSLRNNVNLPPTYAAQSLEGDFAQQVGHPSGPSSAPAETPAATTSNLSNNAYERPPFTDTNPSFGRSPWFRNAQDPEFVEHLLDLYFAWVHPFHRFFSKEHFLFDLRNGRRENCSPALVNAIMAFACHYSDRHAARSNSYSPTTAGDQYFAEARAALEQTDQSRLTSVQALAIMSLRETSQGRESSGYQYAGKCVRMSIELDLQLSLKGILSQSVDVELRKATIWGVFNLETLTSMNMGRISQLPYSAIGVDNAKAVERIEAQLWKPYEETISNNASGVQPLRPSTFQLYLSRLCELTSNTVNTFYAPKESFTSRRLAATYVQYQEWLSSLPDFFCLENTSLPHVICLHMCYHVCIVHLFRPYIKLDLRGANLFPRDTCTQAANEISRLMGALRAMYGLRRVSLPIVNALLSASTIHLLNLPNESSASCLTQAMHDLLTISVNHPYAGRCVDIIRSLGAKWNIALPDDAAVNSARLGPISSPATSIFYASSMPRQHSSSSRGRSGDESSKNVSPFPPVSQQSLDGYETMPASATLPMQQSFWPSYTSAPMTREPVQESDFQDYAMQAWPIYDPGQQTERRQSAPVQNDEQPHGQGTWDWMAWER